MAQKLPLFPLNLVVFPGESLSLHIFEPRYRQLIHDCQEDDLSFGIPTYLDKKVGQYGTEVSLVEIVNAYSDGRMDIRAKGQRVFKVLDFENPMEGKLYAGGEVEFMETEDDANASEKILLVEKARELYDILNVEVTLTYEMSFISYKVAHKIGLSMQQEYSLLQLTKESERIRFILDHLTRSIPILREAENTKRKVQMNGHFRNFDPLNF